MIAAFVLVIGVMLVLVVGGVMLIAMGNAHILPTIVPLAPWLVAAGSVMLILTECLLFFGGKEDRRAALRDLGYLFPTFLISLGLWWLASHFLW
ncbi:MAG: hypothetical protein ABFD54_14425 [Armatimonadota bacterium]|nr:hypothetical protein [bacterium]